MAAVIQMINWHVAILSLSLQIANNIVILACLVAYNFFLIARLAYKCWTQTFFNQTFNATLRKENMYVNCSAGKDASDP